MLTTPTRPSLVDRTMSNPLSVNTMVTPPQSGHVLRQSKLALNVLTPPSSPRLARSSSDISYITDSTCTDDMTYFRRRSVSRFSMSFSDERTSHGIWICPYDVQILKDSQGRNQEFGHGAWSKVFRGTCHRKPVSGLVTPPASPIPGPPVLVAIKQPLRNDARAILESEARILSRLMEEPDNQAYIIQFYGMIQSTSSLILAALPLSLDDHIRRCATSALISRTTANMCQPVIGTTNVWLNMASKLVSALFWLHEQAEVIHGDIKPGNILLDRIASDDDVNVWDVDQDYFPYDPVFADFSSSQRVNGETTPNTLSAVTRDYTAPELLSSKVLSDPSSTATKASDVFSLAVTLLVAASGNTRVYSGTVFQRQVMATQGWMVIQNVRNGEIDEGARVSRVIAKALEGAVLRDSSARISAIRWKRKMEDMVSAESSDG